VLPDQVWIQSRPSGAVDALAWEKKTNSSGQRSSVPESEMETKPLSLIGV